MASTYPINKRISDAYEISTSAIEDSLPPSLLTELHTLGEALSAPWMGLLIGILSPVQYAMRFAHVDIDNSIWKEPTILWTLQHSSSGTRKSNIHKYVAQFSPILEDDHTFKVDEITFEKLGTKMQQYNNSMYWIFDEARSFFAQLGMYQKGGNSCRDEAALLKLYDGGSWCHDTVKGAQFDMPFTKLVLGGYSQTSHIIKLLHNTEQMESGFIPRFLTFLLNPVYTDVTELTLSNPAFDDRISEVLQSIKQFHDDCQTVNTKWRIYRDSLAFQSFANYHKKVNDWMKINHYKLELQNVVTMLAKSTGQIIRLSAILNAFFLFYDMDAVTTHESDASSNNESINFLYYMFGDGEAQTQNMPTPISLMAMQTSINIVAYSISQSFILQGVKNIKIDINNNDINFVDIDKESDDVQQQPQQQQPGSSKSSQHTTKPSMSNVGKVITSGGMKLSAKKMNQNKRLGRGKTNLPAVHAAFAQLEEDGFGEMDDEDIFSFKQDIVEGLQQSPNMKRKLIAAGVSLPKFKNSVSKETVSKETVSKENVPPKKVKTTPLINSNKDLSNRQ